MANLFNFGTKDPEEVVRIAAGNLIHTKVYKPEVQSAFPGLKEHYDLTLMQDPEEIYRSIEEGRIVVNADRTSVYERPKGFVDPTLLQANQRFPHECMGISRVVADALSHNGIPVRERFYRTRMRDGWDVVGHWVIEYFDGKDWVLKDPSVPDRNNGAHKDHFYSWQVHDLARANDRIFEEFRDLYESGDTEQTKEIKRKADAMKTLVYDAWTLQHGAPMIAKYRISCDGVPLGSTGLVETQVELFDAYGRDFRDALQVPDLDAVAKLGNRLSSVRETRSPLRQLGTVHWKNT